MSTTTIGPKFRLGQLVATPAADDAMQKALVVPADLLRRHVSGDWGDVHPDDTGLNDDAVRDGDRIMSVYDLPTGETVWIITECDRSVTTILTPDDY